MIDFNSQLPIIPEVYETAQLQDNLEHSGGVTISWKSTEDAEIPIGASLLYPFTKAGYPSRVAPIEHKSIRYVLLDPYAPSQQGGPVGSNACYYKYDVQFKHPQNMLDRIPFWIKTKDSQGWDIHLSTTSYTGFPHTIVQKVVDFMAEYANEMHDDFFAEVMGLNDVNGEWQPTWAYNIPAVVDEHGLTISPHTIITVPFDGCSIKSAVDAIANAMGCNVYWDWSYTEYEDENHNKSWKRTIRFVAGTTIDGESFNCFHVLGGTTNMGKITTSGSFSAVTQRLTLPASHVWNEGTEEEYTEYYPGSIIDMRPNHEGVRLTKDLILDDIFPKMELFIKIAECRVCYLTDEEGNFIVDYYLYYYMNGSTRVYAELDHETDGKYYDAQGHELTRENVLKTFAKWYVSLSTDKTEWDEQTQTWEQYEQYARDHWTDYDFDQSLLIDDKSLSLLFQLDYKNPNSMSKLVGNQFELTYFPEATKEWDMTDAQIDDYDHYTGDKRSYKNGYIAAAGSYRIAFTAEGEIILPTTSEKGLCPKVGDKVTLVNMALSDATKQNAKVELLFASKEIIGLMETPKGEYSQTVIFGDEDETTHEVPAPRIARIGIGDASPFGSLHGPVVTNINLNIDTNVAELTVGSWTRKTRTGGTADKVETVTVSANSSTNGSNNYSNGYIGAGGGYNTGGSDSQTTYGNATPKPDSLFVAGLNNIMDVVACNTDGKVKMNTDVITKIICNTTKDITSVCNLSYTAWPTDGTNAITVFLEESPTATTQDHPVNQPNTTYDLSETLRYIRVHFPQGFDMAHFNGSLSIDFTIGHPYFNDRVLTLTVDASIPGEQGQSGAFKSRVFCRTNTDISSAVVNGGSYSSPYPTETTISGQTVSITWYDGIPQGEEKLWSTVRTFHYDNRVTSWSTPAQETDTETLDIEFSLSEIQPNAPTGSTPHSDHSSEGWYDPSLNQTLPSGKTWEDMIWRAERKISNGVYDGLWTISRIKGERGLPGGNTATVYLYKRYATAPQSWNGQMPAQVMYYKFADGKLYKKSGDTYSEVLDTDTQYLNGWHLLKNIPSGSDPIYVTSAIAYSSDEYDNIKANEWVTPVLYTENGINSAPVFIYKRADSPTDKPVIDLYYSFADGKLYKKSGNTYVLPDATTEMKGWSLEIPSSESNHNPCWIRQASAMSSSAYDVIETNDWSSMRKLVEDGKSAQCITAKGSCHNGTSGPSNEQVIISDGTNTTTLVHSQFIADSYNRKTRTRGLVLVKINRTTLQPVNIGTEAEPKYGKFYDTYGDNESEGVSRANELATAIGLVSADYFVCLVSYDAIGWSDNLKTALESCGSIGVDVTKRGRYPFAFIGHQTLAQGYAMQIMGELQSAETADAVAYIGSGAIFSSKDGKDGADGADGADGTYYVDEFARGSSRSDHSSTTIDGRSITSPIDQAAGWSDTAPAATSTHPYIWKRICLFDPNSGQGGSYGTFSYICETGEDGPQGEPGEPGAAGNDGVTYSATVSPLTVSFDGTSSTQSYDITNGCLYERVGSGQPAVKYCHWGIFTRSGSSYTRKAASAEKAGGWGGFSSVQVSNVTSSDDAIVVFFGENIYTDNDPETTGYYAKIEIPIVKEGLQGCVVRVSEYKSTQVYRNDEGVSGLSVGYVDVVGVADSSTYGYTFYRYINSTPSSGHQPPNSTYWELLQDVGPIFTSLLIAKNAYIKFGTGNQFVITDAYNDIQAGMKGDGDIRIWAGGNNVSSASDANISDAPFRVDKNGKLYATDGEFSGKITASTIQGTGVYVKSSDSATRYIRLKPSDTSIEGYSNNSQTFKLYTQKTYSQGQTQYTSAALEMGSTIYAQDMMNISDGNGSYILLYPSGGALLMVRDDSTKMFQLNINSSGYIGIIGRFAFPDEADTSKAGEIYKDSNGYLHVRLTDA